MQASCQFWYVTVKIDWEAQVAKATHPEPGSTGTGAEGATPAPLGTGEPAVGARSGGGTADADDDDSLLILEAESAA